MIFNFPAYKDIPYYDDEHRTQLIHTIEECVEALEALEKYGSESPEFIMEILDISHSNETSIRGIRQRDCKELNDYHSQVIDKNKVRGYYG